MRIILQQISIILFIFLAEANARSFENISIVEPPENGNGKLLIIVPAKKYSMEKPLFSKLAKAAKNEGYTVVRFNWKFFTNNSSPSEDLKEEAIELSNIILKYQKELKFSSKNTVVLAKSFGSKVLSKAPPSLYSDLALVTPNCSKQNQFYETYKKVFIRNKRIQISISLNDPYCDVKQIYSVIQRLGRNVSIYTTYGDHNFSLNKKPNNQNNMVSAITNFLNNLQ